MTSRLADAVDGVYQAFDDLPRPRTIETCPCCFDADNANELLKSDLRNIDLELLSDYNSSALSTIGSKRDYLYFLPATFEALSTDDTFGDGMALTGIKIGMTDITSWPSHHRLAVEEYFIALVDEEGTTGLGVNIDDLICGFGNTGFAIETFLQLWVEWPDSIGRFHEANASLLAKKQRLSNPFWEKGNAAHDRIVDWLSTKVISTLVDDYYRRTY